MTNNKMVKVKINSALKLSLAIENIFNAFNLDKKLKNKTVVIKPNWVAPQASKTGVTTDLRLVELLVCRIKKIAKKVVIAEGSGYEFDSITTNKILGACQLAKKLKVSLINTRKTKYKRVLVGGKVFKEIHVPECVVQADYIINLPKFKTHMLTKVSFCQKNLFGLIPLSERRLAHAKNLDLAISDLALYFTDRLINIVDAKVCMEGAGPVFGDRKKLNILISSDNALACDIVCCQIAGIKINKVKHLRESIKRVGEPKYKIEGKIPKDIKPFDIPKPSNFYLFVYRNLYKVGWLFGRFVKKWDFVFWFVTQFGTRPRIVVSKVKNKSRLIKSCPVGAIGQNLKIDYKKCRRIRCMNCYRSCPKAVEFSGFSKPKKSKKKLVIICLDAFKPNYLPQTEFLKNFAKQNYFTPIKTIYGYSGIGATAVSGKMPDVHGVWTEYKLKKNPKKNWLLFLLSKIPAVDDLISRKIVDDFLILKDFYLNKSTFLTSIKQIPFDSLYLFEKSLKKNYVQPNSLNVPTVFDHFRKKGITFKYYDWPIIAANKSIGLDFSPNKDSNKTARLLKEINKTDVSWIRLWDLDKIAHKFGPNSEEAAKTIEKLDGYLKKIVEKVDKSAETDFIFWSDHGFIPVVETIDLSKSLKGLAVPYFLDSTMARFYPKKKKEVDQIKKRLSEFGKFGHFLTATEIKRYHLPREQAKLVFVVNPGIIIFPNFYNTKKTEKGMHGYNPDTPGQEAVFISSIFPKKGKKDTDVSQVYNSVVGWIKEFSD